MWSPVSTHHTLLIGQSSPAFSIWLDGSFLSLVLGNTLEKGRHDKELQGYLVNEIQEVYRLQGVATSDKHIQTIVRQIVSRSHGSISRHPETPEHRSWGILWFVLRRVLTGHSVE